MPKNKSISRPCREAICQAEIVFLITKKGKKMPVDAESLSVDDVAALEAGEEVTFRYGDHISHYQTCPAAKTFSKKNP